MAATTMKWVYGATTVLLSTGMNSLANNALAISAVYDNTQAAAGDGSTFCDLELVVTYGTAPANPSACSIWFLGSIDGTNYEDGGTAVTPARGYDLNIPVRPVTTAQRILRRTWFPWGKNKILLKNDGTGQAMGTNGNILTIRLATWQAV